MSNYPNAIDDASTLYSPADAFSAKPLETITTQPVYAGDTTISVESTGVGFPDEYGILSIDDELIVYTGKTATQFTGCQRGAFGTVAAQHAIGATVRANMVSAYIKALQEAVIAIEQELGTASSRNYVRKDGAVTMTGAKAFVDGAEFGSGSKAAKLALPHDDHAPPQCLEATRVCFVARDVPLKFPPPEGGSSLGHDCVLAPLVTVPEAPMDKDHRPPARKHNIRLSRQILAAQCEAKSPAMQQ
jgi:hypothetical protein